MREKANTKLRLLAALPALALLAACATPPASPNAGPGGALADPAQAGALFAQVCIASAPSFTTAPTTLASLPFTQNSNTGTYYHDVFNLSIRPQNGSCSLVFGTDQPTDVAVAGLARGTTSVTTDVPPGIDISSRDGPDGLTYFRMGL